MISQAWHRHRRDQLALSVGDLKIREALMATWMEEMKGYMNEAFSLEMQFPSPFVTEVYTDTEPVAFAARRKGLVAGDSMTLHSGWDFRIDEHRRMAKKAVLRTKPYVLILAFPCGPWSPLLNLNPPKDLEALRAEALVLVEFAIELAMVQLAHGRHYVLENPLPSAAWKLESLQEFASSFGDLEVVVDICALSI